MSTKKEILQKIVEAKEQIGKYGVKRIGVFGSYIRDEQKKESDVDVLVEFEEGMKTFDNYMELKFFLEGLLQREVDLVIYDALKPKIKSYIMREIEYA